MRKQSAETQLRHAKTDAKNLRILIGDLRSELVSRRRCGQMMSNLCFNLAQNDKYDPAHRQSMRDCREDWDSIRTVKIWDLYTLVP